MITKLPNRKFAEAIDHGCLNKKRRLFQPLEELVCDILRAMPSINSTSNWNEPPKDSDPQRSLLRKRHRPLAVYDLSNKKKNSFFAILGKVTFLCLIGFLVTVAIVWTVRRLNPTSTTAASAALASSNEGAAESQFSASYAPTVAQAPQLGYVQSWGITSSGATISWSTNVPCTTSLAYGKTPNLGQVSPLQSALANTHGVTLTGLSSGTTYYFSALSTASNDATGRSTVSSFTTKPGIGAPAMTEIMIAPGQNNHAEISWKTSVPTYSFVQFGPAVPYTRWSARTDLTDKPHPAIAWIPSGVIHYQLVSTDAYGHQTMSPDQTFTEP